MFNKPHNKELDALLNKHNRGSQKYRVHQFPPLRKPWQTTGTQQAVGLDPAEYQKQLMDGFQEGLDKGFEQGLTQGKEEGYGEGVRLGYEEGSKQGKQEGMLIGRQLFEHAAEPMDKMIQSLEEYLSGYETRRRSELLQLVDKVTRQVIRCELALQPTQLLALVDEALTALPAMPEQIKVYVNAAEFARINDAEPEKSREWGLAPDADMAPGECRVVTDTTEMDIGCEHRLEQCMDSLKSHLLTPEDEQSV